MTSNYLSVGETARRIGRGIIPKDISTLFYQGFLRDDLCPVVAGRRLIPETYVPMIEMVLRRRGRLPITSEGQVSHG